MESRFFRCLRKSIWSSTSAVWSRCPQRHGCKSWRRGWLQLEHARGQMQVRVRIFQELRGPPSAAADADAEEMPNKANRYGACGLPEEHLANEVRFLRCPKD